MTKPVVLVAGGLEPRGLAGVLVDAQAVRDAGGVPVVIATALTAQGATFLCQPVPLATVRAQLQAVPHVDAVKLGVVPNRALLRLLADVAPHAPLVIDPVTQTSRGERLSRLRPADYREVGRGVLTPNEAELLWLDSDAARLLALGFDGVVCKGGQSGVDEVFSPREHAVLRGSLLPRSTSHHRGTGCRFASVLATRLAVGDDLHEAARVSKSYVRKFLGRPILDDAFKGRRSTGN